jgi:hypothetical protein
MPQRRRLDEAATGAEGIVRNYDQQCRAARAIAEAYFDSTKVLGRLLNEVGVTPKGMEFPGKPGRI